MRKGQIHCKDADAPAPFVKRKGRVSEAGAGYARAGRWCHPSLLCQSTGQITNIQLCRINPGVLYRVSMMSPTPITPDAFAEFVADASEIRGGGTTVL